jgi:hypothetical protein
MWENESEPSAVADGLTQSIQMFSFNHFLPEAVLTSQFSFIFN